MPEPQEWESMEHLTDYDDPDIEGVEGTDWDWVGVPNGENNGFIGKRRKRRP